MELLGKFFVWVGVGVLKLCDAIFYLFKVLAGIIPIAKKDNQKMDILTFFTSGNTIVKTFTLIFMVSIAIGLIFTVFSLAKNAVTLKKTQEKIMAQYMASIVGTLVCAAMLTVIFVIVGQILGLIDQAFNLGSGTKGQSTGARIMELLVQQAEENMGLDPAVIKERQTNHKIIFEGKSVSQITDEIMGLYKQNNYTGLENIKKDFQDLPFGLGAYKTIRQFFPYAILLVTGFTFLFCSFGAVFALCVRLFDIVFLYFSMPLCLASWAYDDGARFQMWRTTMFSKLVLAFGTIFAVNTFTILIPKIMEINLPDIKNTLIISLFRIFLVVCGGFTISSGQTLMARLLGTDASEARQMGGYLKHAVAGVGATAAFMKKASAAAKNGLFGKKSDPIGTSLKGINEALRGGAIGGLGGMAAGGIGGMMGGGGASSPHKTFTGRNPYNPMKFRGRERGSGLLAKGAKTFNTLGRIMGGDKFIQGWDNLKSNVGIGLNNFKGKVAQLGDSWMKKGGVLGLFNKKNDLNSMKATDFAKNGNPYVFNKRNLGND